MAKENLFEKTIVHSINEIKIELLDEYDKNFSRGAFFSKKWTPRADGYPTHLNNTGKLRRSIRAVVNRFSLTFSSSEPYSRIHNEGGRIKVSPKMHSFFWAMYLKSGKPYFRGLALKKVGSDINIPQRTFIGDAPEVRKIVRTTVTKNVTDSLKHLFDPFKKLK